MPAKNHMDLEELREVVRKALKLLPRESCVVDAYVAHDNRVLRVLRGKRKSDQEPMLTPQQDTWKIPAGHIAEALRAGARQWSDKDSTVCVVCMNASSDEALGFLCLTSAAWKKSAKPSPRMVHKIETLLEASRPALKYVRSQAVLNWRQSALHILHTISKLEIDSLTREELLRRILSAALAIAPTACVAHLVTVHSDEETNKPLSLQLDYALLSETTKPAGQPAVVGVCPIDHPLHSYSVEDSVTGQSAKKGILVYRASLEGIRNYKVFLPTAASEIAIPLKLGDRVIGVLNLESELEDAFSDSDRENLQSLAGLAALHMSATSGFTARIGLYSRGVQTLERLFDRLHIPEELLQEILTWARHIRVPPLEYAVLKIDEHTEYTSGKPVPSDQKDTTEIVTILKNRDKTQIGILTVVTALQFPDLVEDYFATLKAFGPVLAAAIAASTNERSAATIREEAEEVLRNVRHTIVDVREALDTANANTASTEATVRGALECLRVQSDFLVNELTLAFGVTGEVAPVEVTRVVRELAHTMEWQFSSKNMSCKVDAPKGEEIWIRGPDSSFRWALYELLHNAWKFSPRDQSVTVSVVSITGSNYVEVHIADQCPQIDEAEFEDIWKAGYRARNAGETRGSGRGLAIVTRMCDRLKATPAVSHNKRGGNTFTLTFPRLPVG